MNRITIFIFAFVVIVILIFPSKFPIVKSSRNPPSANHEVSIASDKIKESISQIPRYPASKYMTTLHGGSIDGSTVSKTWIFKSQDSLDSIKSFYDQNLPKSTVTDFPDGSRVWFYIPVGFAPEKGEGVNIILRDNGEIEATESVLSSRKM